jgi:hypothetical protein
MSIFKTNRFVSLFGFIAAFGIAVYIYSQNIWDFLSPNEAVKAEMLVVEGWLPDESLKVAAELLMNDSYEMVVVTGGPLDQGSFLSEYETYAGLGCAILKKISGRENIKAVPARFSRKDRTYAAAIALREFLENSGVGIKRINVVSLDVHGRRSWYLFKKALGNNYSVGIISIRKKDCIGSNWWNSSQKFKKVIEETIAYIYTVVIFRFADEPS